MRWWINPKSQPFSASSSRCAVGAGGCARPMTARRRQSPSGWDCPRSSPGGWPNAAALLRLKEEGAAIVVTVDCGATAHDPLAAAAEAGLDVIVVDHHVSEPLLPRALAVINPNRLDDDSPHGALAAVGVAFLLVVALNRALREAGWYRNRA